MCLLATFLDIFHRTLYFFFAKSPTNPLFKKKLCASTSFTFAPKGFTSISFDFICFPF